MGMKKVFCVILALTLLTGCRQPKTFETMSDTYIQPDLPQAKEVVLLLPEDAAKAVLEAAGTGTLYLCDGYSVAVQTLPAGNLDATLREVTGYGREKVQLWEMKEGEISRYSCVWASAGEGGDQMGKATILDDGNYHYVLSVMAPAEETGALADTWQQLMDSFSIAP
jgi:hypothetical protein